MKVYLILFAYVQNEPMHVLAALSSMDKANNFIENDKASERERQGSHFIRDGIYEIKEIEVI